MDIFLTNERKYDKLILMRFPKYENGCIEMGIILEF